ncbi:hypothetical protein [Streptomyces griseoruber]|uniref:hypothetical protein n=1 Tax=Streptomyces griseoruber TaxID=1943 RepID=UPI00099EA24E|nr:hypothetical protein [Streptomyces griseoruber]
MAVVAAAQTANSDWTWAETTALIVPFVALFGAFLTYALNQRAVRKERRATTFAEEDDPPVLHLRDEPRLGL